MESRKGLYGRIEASMNSATSCGAFCGCACFPGGGICLGAYERGAETGTKYESSKLVKSLTD